MSRYPGPRVREMHAEYVAGRITWDDLVKYVNAWSEWWESTRGKGAVEETSTAGGS